MPTLTRYIVDFTTPVLGAGLLATMPLVDFIANVRVGTRAQLGSRGVDRNSMVVATLSEMANAPGRGFEFPFIGYAPMEVRNVAPRDDGIVSFWVHVDWHEVLHLRLSLLVIND